MKKRALRKDFRVEVKKSLNRFLSIFFIVALGVAFYSGIQSAAPSMRQTGDQYFDDTNLMDIRVISTLGLTDDDLKALSEVEGVSYAAGAYMEDVYCGEGETQEVIHIESLPDGINELAVMEGTLPKKAGECFLDIEYAKAMGYEPGDTLLISVDDEDSSSLKRRSFTISGCGYSPTYISFERGSTSLGTGSLSGFAYVLPQDFDAEVYSVAYLHADGAKDELAFTEEYDELVSAVYDRIEGIADARCEIRYDEVMSEAQEKIDEARAEVQDGKQELEDAKKELEDGKAEAESELAEAQSELEDGESQLEDGKQELEDAKVEFEDGEREIADGEQELAANESTLADGWQQFYSGEQQLNSGEQEYQAGVGEYNAQSKEALAQLNAAQKQIDDGQAQIEAGWSEYETGLAQLEEQEPQARQALEEAQQQLEEKQAEYDAGVAALADAKAQYEQAAAGLPSMQESYNAAVAQLGALSQQADALEAERQTLQSAYDTNVSEAASWRTQEQEALERKATAESTKNEKAVAKTNAEAERTNTDGEINLVNAQIEVINQNQALSEEEKQSQRAPLQEQLSGLNDKKAALDGQIASLDGEIATLEGTISAEQQSADAAASQAQALEDSLPAQQQQISEKEEAAAAKSQEIAGVQAGADQLKQGIDQLTAAKQTLDSQEAALAAGGQELSEGWAAFEAQKTSVESELASGREALETAKATLETKEKELAAAQKEVDDGKRELQKAEAKLTSARRELDLGWAQLNNSRNQLASGTQQLEDGRQQLTDARSQLEEARQQIADAQKEIADNEQKIEDGWEDYEEGRLEAEREIADGEQKIRDAEQELLDAEKEIADAQAELDDVKFPEWYVDDRSVLPEHSGFGENAERVGNLAQVVPVLFFLVAALISLTTMTRMVEEERTQIGTLKALGYSKAAIASKFLKYAFWATIGGSVVGVLVGEKLLPWVVINAYGIIYIYLPEILVPYNWPYALLATGAALLCTIGATLSSCYRELRAVPAELMRPPAPKQGKRVWLEKIPFLWNRLNFTWKSTVRNLIRYKKRFLMTVFGIGGCMGLLLIGYGLQDSITDIGVLQFEDLQLYDVMTILDADAPKEEQQEPVELLENDSRVSQYMRFYMQQQEVLGDEETNKEWNAYVYVPETLEQISDFLCFRDRETKQTYELTDEGAIITEKVATELGIRPGSVMTLRQEDGEEVQVPVLAVCENYLAHYIYMTPALYEKVYGEAPEYNSIFWKSDEDQSVIEDIGEKLLAEDAVLNITYTRTMSGQIDSMIGAMDIVMVVLIVSAGMLAFVVLYNLNNININERRRELATLKVLGFFDGEVAAYVYRENILLTIIGAALGCVIGKVLHAYVITTVEVDVCMFGRNINPPSFLYGILFTVGFSVIVNLAMYFKLKKIDMVESLKSIE